MVVMPGTTGAREALLQAIDEAQDAEVLVDAAWKILYRVRELATAMQSAPKADWERYKLEFLLEGCDTGDLNLLEIGINRFRDIDPGEDGEED